MRNFTKLVIASALLATQATPTDSAVIAAAVQTSVPTVVSQNSQITFQTTSATPVALKLPADPNFDTEVLTPLRAAQAKAAADAAALAAAAKRAKTTTVVASTSNHSIAPATPENMLKLRYCESGNTYNRNSGNGYYGAYQYDIGTWGNYGGYARADLAPADVQDAKFMATWNARGWSPWPSCSRQLGFM